MEVFLLAVVLLGLGFAGIAIKILIKKDGYNDERVSGNITEDKSWTIALTPIV